MTDKCGKKIKEGDIVQVTYYDFWQSLCGAFFRMVSGELQHIKGNIPKDYYTSEIDAERYSEEEVNGIKS